MKIAYLNKKFIPLDRARVSALDRGFLYGDGAFETMRSYEGCIFRLEEHVERLFNTLKALHIRPGISKLKMQKTACNLLKKNKLKNAYIKIIVTRGEAKGLLTPSGNSRPTHCIYALPHKPLPRNVYERGIKIFISGGRVDEKSPVAGKKTLNYLANILCRHEAEKRGFDDTLLVNTGGFVTEASSSNVFLVKGKKLYTPCLKSGILPGITRKEIICLVGKFLKRKISEGFVKKGDLYKADEIFLTNSLTEIVPVVRINHTVVGNGKPGLVTGEIATLFKAFVRKYCKGKRGESRVC